MSTRVLISKVDQINKRKALPSNGAEPILETIITWNQQVFIIYLLCIFFDLVKKIANHYVL